MYGTELWTKLRPWIWPSAEDLATLSSVNDPIPSLLRQVTSRVSSLEAQADKIDSQIADLLAKGHQPIEPSAFYITQASKAFLEHMADHRASVAQTMVTHAEALEQRMASLEREMDGLREEVDQTRAKLTKALARLRGLGED